MEHNVPMRKSNRRVTDRERIDQFLKKQRIGYLGLSDQTSPYVVPLNFYWSGEKLYFHGADSGRKAAILAQSPLVCFTVAEELATLTSPIPAHTTTAYFSVMLFGRVRKVEPLDEQREAMQQLLDKFVPGFFQKPLAAQHLARYRSSLGSRTVIYCLEPEEIAAKENPIDPARAFPTAD